MDTSGTYIKMSECKEIQKGHEFTDEDYCHQVIKPNVVLKPNAKVGHIVWLPRQDQLQEMVLKYWWDDEPPGNSISAMLQNFD